MSKKKELRCLIDLSGSLLHIQKFAYRNEVELSAHVELAPSHHFKNGKNPKITSETIHRWCFTVKTTSILDYRIFRTVYSVYEYNWCFHSFYVCANWVEKIALRSKLKNAGAWIFVLFKLECRSVCFHIWLHKIVVFCSSKGIFHALILFILLL